MSEREIIPEGFYSARATGEFVYDKTPGKGTPYVRVQYEVMTAGAWLGEKVRWTGWLTPAARKRTLEALRISGWDPACNDLMKLTGLGSCNVQIEVEHETADDGKVWPRVKWVNRESNFSTESSMSEGDKRAFFQSMMGDVIASGDSARKSGAKPASAPGRASTNADGMPVGADGKLAF
jgi:hypothetical protein